MVPITILIVNLFIFLVGLIIVVSKQNMIFIIIGIELILQAATSNCILFNNLYTTQLEGHILIIFSLTISICEIGLVIALFLRMYQAYKSTSLAHLVLSTHESNTKQAQI